jgi:FkbM family methyltransferase
MGDWSLACASICRHATIHAFEIAPETFERLHTRTVDNVRIIANPFGLSDTDGESAINVHPTNSYLTSLIAGVDQIHRCDFAIEKARVAIGDEYCAARAIEHIDLLKIDTEGAEHLVLGGLRRMLSEGRIEMIQFEYGMANLFSKFILRDFYLMLEPYGFTIGKLFPNRVDFRPWRPEDEDFRGPNFVAAAAGHRLLNS